MAQPEKTSFMRKRDIRLLAIVFVTMFLLTGVNILYTNQQAQKFCALMITLDESYSQFKPRTEAGKKVAQNVHDLRKSLDCKEK